MPTMTVEWVGNEVRLEDIESTDLTLVQWRRPFNGPWRGAHVLDPDELRHVRLVIGRLDRLRRESPATGGAGMAARYVRSDLAGSPVHLESLLGDLLER